jgi:hypothetical protein
MLGAPDFPPRSVTTKTDMWDPLLSQAHLSCSHTERQRGGKPAFIPPTALETGEAVGGLPAGHSPVGEVVGGRGEVVGKLHGDGTHP